MISVTYMSSFLTDFVIEHLPKIIWSVIVLVLRHKRIKVGCDRILRSRLLFLEYF
jgi:hypothetical protein